MRIDVLRGAQAQCPEIITLSQVETVASDQFIASFMEETYGSTKRFSIG